MNKILFTLSAFTISWSYSQETLKAPTIDLSKNIGIQKTELSNKVRPGDNFYEYVNEKWIKTNPIPNTQASWGMFDILVEDSKNVLKEIAEKSLKAENPIKNSSTQLIKDFYFSGTNEEAFAAHVGDEIISKIVFDMTNIKSHGEGIKFLSKLLLLDINVPFNFYVSQDAKDSKKNILYLVPSGLGLPDRDYYIRTDENSKEIIKKYRDYILSVQDLINIDITERDSMADEIIRFETYLASNMLSMVDKRDPYKTYHKYAYEDALKEFGISYIDSILKNYNITTDSIIITEPEYFNALNKVINSENQNGFKLGYYIVFQTVNSLAKYLSDDYVNTRFDFYGKTLYGMPEIEPRWKRVCTNMDMLLVDAVGQEYIKYRFSPTAKAKALTLVENLRTAYATRIKNLQWMSETTKVKALEKLNKIDVKIGYPNKWIDYSTLNLQKQAYVYNIIALKEFENRRQLLKLTKPVDRSEWLMGAQTVNAYYNPTLNEIVFPAAILQPPFFSEKADDACNYGGIGMVIGHEFTHGFDDEGRQYDAYGNLTDWWTKEDAAKFEELAQAFVEQYNAYEPLDSLHVNGELTLGENLADMGGLVIAYDAFKIAVPNEKPIDGLTPSERFFINLAKIWCGDMRTDALRNQILTDPHSPAIYRVNGPLSNFDIFYKTYNLQPYDKMYKDASKRAFLW